ADRWQHQVCFPQSRWRSYAHALHPGGERSLYTCFSVFEYQAIRGWYIKSFSCKQKYLRIGLSMFDHRSVDNDIEQVSYLKTIYNQLGILATGSQCHFPS